MELSERIKALRIDRGLSQKEMALSLDIALSTYQYYERGERTPPADVLIKIVTSYGVSPSWLLMGEGDMNGTKSLVPFDRAFLKELAETMEELISLEHLKLPSAKKADCLVLLYETLCKEEHQYSGEMRQKFLKENVAKFLRLTA